VGPRVEDVPNLGKRRHFERRTAGWESHEGGVWSKSQMFEPPGGAAATSAACRLVEIKRVFSSSSGLHFLPSGPQFLGFHL
jgi:hypothetical protein